jgi:uncharacterized protein (TIGR00369 family)
VNSDPLNVVAPVDFDLDPTATGLELLRRWAAKAECVGGYPQRLRARPVEFEEGLVRIICDLDPGHANFMGLVHGGVSASLVDVAGGSAVMTILQPGQHLLTTDLSMRFLNAAPIGCGRLEAVGRIVYQDDRKVVVEVTVSTDDGLVIAQGTVGVAIRSPR